MSDTHQKVPDSYDELVRQVRDLKSRFDHGHKQYIWSVGKCVHTLMGDSHGESYGRHTVDNLGEAVGIKAPTLYGYRAVYLAYKDDDAFNRAMSRPEVLSAHMHELGRLTTDKDRDEFEQLVIRQRLTTKQLKHRISEFLGKPLNRKLGAGDPRDEWFEIFKDAEDRWSWHLKAGNGRIVAVSYQSYENRGDMLRSLDAVMRAGSTTEVKVLHEGEPLHPVAAREVIYYGSEPSHYGEDPPG